MRLAALLALALAAPVAAPSQDLILQIPPVKTTFQAGGQPIPVTAWGSLSSAPAGAIRLALTADLAGLQDNLTPLLAAELNRQDRCGERLAVNQAEIVPAEPSALLTVHLRYEKWACAKVFGKEAVKRLVGGNAVVKVKLTPAAAADGIGMNAEVAAMDADGSLGEVLRSGSLGASVKEKIANSIRNAIRKSLDLKAALPERIGAAVAFESARFTGSPERRLWITAAAAVHLSPEEWQALSRQMKAGR